MSGLTGKYTGVGVSDNDVLFTTADMSSYDTFMLHSSAGAVDVLVSLDGTTFTTDPLSLADLGATSLNPVLLTAPGRMYGFKGSYKAIKVLQNGVTAATAILRYSNAA